jgi:hypothetical protein
MKKRLLVVILILIPFVLAGTEDINVSYPGSVLVGEEFEFKISFEYFDEDIYDIKFEIKNGSDNIADRFWEDGWKSTHFWVEDFLNFSEINESVIRLKIVDNYNGANEFDIKIRDSSGAIFEFIDYSLNISFVDAVDEVDESNDAEIYYELDWDSEDIENGRSFKIKTDAFNLNEDKYDVRLWIEFEENNTIISEIYDSNEEKWLSGNYYIDEIFEGPGNQSDKIKIRIKEKYEYFEGDARIYFKLRNEVEWDKKIEILEKKDSVIETNNNIGNDKISESSKKLIDEYIERDAEKNVIKLGQKIDTGETEDLKVTGNIIYQSKTEIIKSYSVYFLALLVVVFCVLIVWRKLE